MGAAQFFDVVMALVIVTFGFIGFLRGFAGAVMSFAGLSCGTYFAWEYNEAGTELFLQYFPNVNGAVANLAAMTIIFLAVAILASMLSWLLGSFIKFANLSGLNKMIGMIMGLAAGGVLLLAAYAALTRLAPADSQGWVNDSILMGVAEIGWPYAEEFLNSFGVDVAGLLRRAA